jgi:hypothetical protein
MEREGANYSYSLERRKEETYLEFCTCFASHEFLEASLAGLTDFHLGATIHMRLEGGGACGIEKVTSLDR